MTLYGSAVILLLSMPEYGQVSQRSRASVKERGDCSSAGFTMKFIRPDVGLLLLKSTFIKSWFLTLSGPAF